MSCVLKTAFNSTTYHSDLSPMFLNCLLLDPTVIDLMSLFKWTNFGSKLQKILECGRPGGGGSSVISDTPGRGGRGCQKMANFCGRPLWMAPYRVSDRM